MNATMPPTSDPLDGGRPPEIEMEHTTTTSEQMRTRLSAISARAAPHVLTIDGVLFIVVGIYALIPALNSTQGEGFLLVVGGGALILFGLMTIIRWNLPAVRTGLIGLTAGYFASALSEFQTATDPCDIGATFERCAGHVPGGHPWLVYQGPLLLAILVFVFIACQPPERAASHEQPARQ
jgi:hypothetical protein